MARKCLLIGLFALLAAPSAGARPVQVMPGVTYEHRLVWTALGPLSTYVVTAPKPGGLYSLTPLLSNNTITGRETVSSMERRASSQMTTIGVNGDFFNWAGGWPSGLLMQGGVLEHQPADNRSAVGIDAGGTLHVDKLPFLGAWRGVSALNYPLAQLNEPPRPNGVALFTPVWGTATPVIRGTAAVLEPLAPTVPFKDLTGNVTTLVSDSAVPIPRDGAVLAARGSAAETLQYEAQPGGQLTLRLALPRTWATVTDAVGGGPALVKDGKPIANNAESLTPVQLNGRDPRTAIGQRADGSLVLIAADGREPGWSVGISNWDLALALIRNGAVVGSALDSGGSTTVAFDGKVLNRPSDPGHVERSVGEALVIAYTGVYAPSPAPTLSPNSDRIGDREMLTYKLVRPSTVSAKLVAPDGTARELDAGQKAPGWYRVSWDGLDASGAPAPEGTYTWSVGATDDLGRASTATRTFTLDKTLGFARIGRNARTIRFALTRDASIRVTIEDRAGDILKTVATGPRPAGPVTVKWNGRDGRGKRVRSGFYVAHIAAASVVGLSELRLPVSIRR